MSAYIGVHRVVHVQCKRVAFVQVSGKVRNYAYTQSFLDQDGNVLSELTAYSDNPIPELDVLAGDNLETYNISVL